jgi:acetyltransferase-like isoleucine patch superfamily enzyme
MLLPCDFTRSLVLCCGQQISLTAKMHSSRKLRIALCALGLPLPSVLKIPFYRFALGWKIGSNVKIGLSIFDAEKVELGDNVRIGHLNFSNCASRISVGPGSIILNNNMISGGAYAEPGWVNTLHIGEKCVITSKHFFDVGGGVSIGNHTTIAGRDSQLWSHTIKFQEGRHSLTPLPLSIGSRTYLGARCTVLFCTIPDNCLVGAGSVVNKSIPPSEDVQVVAGNPATVRRTYPAERS